MSIILTYTLIEYRIGSTLSFRSQINLYIYEPFFIYRTNTYFAKKKDSTYARRVNNFFGARVTNGIEQFGANGAHRYRLLIQPTTYVNPVVRFRPAAGGDRIASSRPVYETPG